VARDGKAAPSGPADAIIEGDVLFCGGSETIPPRQGCPVEIMHLCSPEGCITADRVAVIDAHRARVASQRLRNARFRLHVRPGTYTVELVGDGKRVHGRVLESERVVVRVGHTTVVEFLWPRSP
jgi:hypothetical protein